MQLTACAALLVGLASVMTSCSSKPDAAADAAIDGNIDAVQLPDAFVDLSGPLYQPDRVVAIELTLPAQDWDLLRYQRRTFFELLGGQQCFAEPFVSPFSYVKADVKIDGQVVSQVGVRKKGFVGSLNEDKPSLKIKFDEFVDGQSYLTRRSVTLNNSVQDPSFVRQCVAFNFFRRAGIPAPRCNYATVNVNGESLGLYVNVEGLDKQFLQRTYGEVEGDGDLYEGTLSDFHPKWFGTFEKDTNKSQPSTILGSIRDALALDDSQLVAELEKYIDLNQFIRFWAVESLLRHWDGYAGNQNNFYIYQRPGTGKVEFLPWGVDQIWRLENESPASVYLNGYIAKRLYRIAALRDRYNNELRRLLDETFREADISAEIEQMRTLLAANLTPDSNAAINEVIRKMSLRRAEINAELAGTLPMPGSEIREPFCLRSIGAVSGSFQGQWRTLGLDPFVHQADVRMTVRGNTPTPVRQGITAGPSPGDRVELNLVAEISAGVIWVVQLQGRTSQFTPGDHAIDGVGIDGSMFQYNFATNAFAQLGWHDGRVNFTSLQMMDNGVVQGTITATLQGF